jgi:E3 ubiquitin-protein ligase synoviolin
LFLTVTLIITSYSIIRHSGPPQPTNTSQSEASSSKQCTQDQSQQFQNTSNPSAALPSIVPGVVGSETNTQDLEKSLQKAQENFIRSQIEVQRFLIP